MRILTALPSICTSCSRLATLRTLNLLFAGGLLLALAITQPLQADGVGEITPDTAPGAARKAPMEELQYERLLQYLEVGDGDMGEIVTALASNSTNEFLRNPMSLPEYEIRLQIAAAGLTGELDSVKRVCSALEALPRSISFECSARHPLNALALLWSGLLSQQHFESAFYVAERISTLFSSVRHSYHYTPITSAIARDFERGIEHFKHLLESNVVSYGDVYIYPSIAADQGLRDGYFLSPLTYADLMLSQMARRVEGRRQTSVTFDLPELELWLDNLVQDEAALASMLAREDNSRAWQYIRLRIQLRAATSSKNKAEAEQRYEELVDFCDQANAEIDESEDDSQVGSFPGGLLAALNFRVASIDASPLESARAAIAATRSWMTVGNSNVSRFGERDQETGAWRNVWRGQVNMRTTLPFYRLFDEIVAAMEESSPEEFWQIYDELPSESDAYMIKNVASRRTLPAALINKMAETDPERAQTYVNASEAGDLMNDIPLALRHPSFDQMAETQREMQGLASDYIKSELALYGPVGIDIGNSTSLARDQLWEDSSPINASNLTELTAYALDQKRASNRPMAVTLPSYSDLTLRRRALFQRMLKTAIEVGEAAYQEELAERAEKAQAEAEAKAKAEAKAEAEKESDTPSDEDSSDETPSDENTGDEKPAAEEQPKEEEPDSGEALGESSENAAPAASTPEEVAQAEAELERELHALRLELIHNQIAKAFAPLVSNANSEIRSALSNWKEHGKNDWYTRSDEIGKVLWSSGEAILIYQALQEVLPAGFPRDNPSGNAEVEFTENWSRLKERVAENAMLVSYAELGDLIADMDLPDAEPSADDSDSLSWSERVWQLSERVPTSNVKLLPMEAVIASVALELLNHVDDTQLEGKPVEARRQQLRVRLRSAGPIMSMSLLAHELRIAEICGPNKELMASIMATLCRANLHAMTTWSFGAGLESCWVGNGYPYRCLKWIPPETPEYQQFLKRELAEYPLDTLPELLNPTSSNGQAWRRHEIGALNGRIARSARLACASGASISFTSLTRVSQNLDLTEPFSAVDLADVSAPMDTLAWGLAHQGDLQGAADYERYAAQFAFGSSELMHTADRFQRAADGEPLLPLHIHRLSESDLFVQDMPELPKALPPVEESDAASDGEDEAPSEAPAEEKPAKVEPTEEAPAEEKPAKVDPTEEAPAEEKPAKVKPAEEAPAEEKPAKVEPTEEAPAEDKPANEKPAKAEPADEAPAGDQPAEKPTEPKE